MLVVNKRLSKWVITNQDPKYAPGKGFEKNQNFELNIYKYHMDYLVLHIVFSE